MHEPGLRGRAGLPALRPPVQARDRRDGARLRGLFGVGGALVCAVAGLMLLGVHAQDENSLLEAIAHGIGVYCIGRAGLGFQATIFHQHR